MTDMEEDMKRHRQESFFKRMKQLTKATRGHVQPSWMRTTNLQAPWVSHWPGGEDTSTTY